MIAMFERELSPPRNGRLSSSSGSPDSLYKSSTDSSMTFNFSPDSNHTSTACKPPPLPLPKFRIDDDSESEWEPSLASPIRSKPPSLRKATRARSRLSSPACKENIRPSISSPVATPPHKRLRALQLNDISTTSPSHSSPMRSQRRTSPRASLFGSARKAMRHSPISKKPSANPFSTPPSGSRIGRCSLGSAGDSGFQDDSWLLEIGKSDTSSIDMECDQKLPLQEMSTSRYKEEFCEDCSLGSGAYGTVFKCINKLDGLTYAVKRSREPVAGSAYEAMARREVYAHAVLGKHSHVVRYFSAWAENGHLFIQNEFCNGGSLAEEIKTHARRGTRFTEAELKDILKQVAHGLKYIHAQSLVHMDIKPGNIFIQYNPQVIQSPESGIEEDSSDSELTDRITYKIGDFGHVTHLNTTTDLEEGDCRYLPKEILNDDHSHLTKADIFALGLTIYQAATLTELPKNGDQWHAIREGNLPYMTGYSSALNEIVRRMVDPSPIARPVAAIIASHPELCPIALRSRQQLARELNEERFKNQLLAKQLKAVQEHAEMKSFSSAGGSRSGRLLGLKVNRSRSLTNF